MALQIYRLINTMKRLYIGYTTRDTEATIKRTQLLKRVKGAI